MLKTVAACAMVALSGCDAPHRFTPEERVVANIKGTWFGATLDVRNSLLLGGSQYYEWKEAGGVTSRGRYEVRVLENGRFELRYVPAQGSALPTDIGWKGSERSLYLQRPGEAVREYVKAI